MKEFLSGTDQRLLLGYCSDSILNRQGKNAEIESWFPENTLDAMFYDLLLDIMDASLSFRDGTTMQEIRSFLKEDISMYQVQLNDDQISRLAEYMVKDILQNSGKTDYFRVFDTAQQCWKQMPVRLIEDTVHEDEIYYRLSEQGYDFLLRTKEIDSQYDGWVSMMIMQQKLKHGNFKDSKDQCRQCLNILRREEAQFDAFVAKVRQDVNSIGNEEYSRMISSYYENLEEEKDLTDAVIKLIEQYRQDLSQQDEQSFHAGDEIKENLNYLREMAQMLDIISADEGKLLGRRYSVRDLYSEMLDENLTIAPEERYDFYQTVILPFASLSGNHQSEMYKQLLRPLAEPQQNKIFDLHLLYQEEKKITAEDNSETVLTVEDMDDHEEQEKAELWSGCYQSTIDSLLQYCREYPDGFAVKDFIAWYQQDESHEIPDDKIFYLIFLSLYGEGTVELKTHPSREIPSMDFDLNDVLLQIEAEHPDFYHIEKLLVYSEEETDLYQSSSTDQFGMSRICIKPVMRRPG